MLTRQQRSAILELHSRQIPKRQIARTLRLSIRAVRKVIKSQSNAPLAIARAEKAEPYRERILELFASCKGNLVRVHEELLVSGAQLSYPALTGFCRRHGIGRQPKRPAGQYVFEPAEELQHDTSRHSASIGGKLRHVQTASAVLCYSRMLFFQCYPTFQRFDCKVFLTEALTYFGGAAQRVMIDNTHVIVSHGTGRDMVPAPEMAAFAARFGFHFVAHERGDANRSARVERNFDFIEQNFFAGRVFESWDDLNRQSRQWCDRVNGSLKKSIRAIPRELFAIEHTRLRPLPAWIPEVYRLHERIVDTAGFVALHSNRYSVPTAWIGRRVEVRETSSHIHVQLDARTEPVTHVRIAEPLDRHITLPEHRPPRGQGIKRSDPLPQERALLQLAPELGPYVAALRQRKYSVVSLRQLLRMVRDYPRPPLVAAVEEAARYGLYDMARLERMILRLVASDYFLLKRPKGNPNEDE